MKTPKTKEEYKRRMTALGDNASLLASLRSAEGDCSGETFDVLIGGYGDTLDMFVSQRDPSLNSVAGCRLALIGADEDTDLSLSKRITSLEKFEGEAALGETYETTDFFSVVNPSSVAFIMNNPLLLKEFLLLEVFDSISKENDERTLRTIDEIHEIFKSGKSDEHIDVWVTGIIREGAVAWNITKNTQSVVRSYPDSPKRVFFRLSPAYNDALIGFSPIWVGPSSDSPVSLQCKKSVLDQFETFSIIGVDYTKNK
jgi:hypothetical protein